MAPGMGGDAIQAVYVIAVLNSVVLAGVLWRHRERPGATPLLANVLAAAVWTGTGLALMRLESGPLALALFALMFLGVGAATMTLLVFTLEYTGRERFTESPFLAALSVEPMLVVFFVVANPGNLFYTLHGGIVEWGPAFWIHTAYSYTVLAVATGLIGEFLYRSKSLYRGQSAALLAGTVAAWVANGVYTVGPIEVDTTPIGFIATGALYAIAIVRYRLTDVAPIARDRVLDSVTDGVFVVDTRNRLIDVNPVGRAWLEEFDESPIGADLDSLFADLPGVRDELRDLGDRPVETERELALRDGHFHVRTTPIEDGRDRRVGWLFVVRDITERKRREARLRRQNERLERFADLVSHDLRNPLNVADGYLELAREVDDDEAYLDEVERSHERMETIIEDVLALAREGADVTDPEPVALADIAGRAWNGVDTGAASIAIDADASILADPERTTRLLENLFRNSLEHGTERADGADLEVTVGALDDARDGSVAGFYVADDGVGIPPSHRDRVFEGGYTTDEDGTGFGLAIVDEIATAHDWTSAVTESDAGGARFEFRDGEPAAAATDSDAGSESRHSSRVPPSR